MVCSMSSYYPDSLDISNKTTNDMHIARLRQKLGDEGRERIQTVERFGYRFSTELTVYLEHGRSGHGVGARQDGLRLHVRRRQLRLLELQLWRLPVLRLLAWLPVSLRLSEPVLQQLLEQLFLLQLLQQLF